MDTSGYLIITVIALLISYWIFYEIIKSATKAALRDVVQRELIPLKAYKLAELKKKGVTSADVDKAIKYLQYKSAIRNSQKNQDELKRLEDWWMSDETAIV